MSINKQIVFTAVLLIATILLFGISSLDITIQNAFYNIQTQSWIVDKESQPYHFIFYTGIKICLILFAVILLLILLFFRNHPKIRVYKKGLLIVILSAVLVPYIVVEIKKNTHIPCPKNEIHYGGKYIHTAVWERYEAPYNRLKKISCWPAGHASGGFALMSLFFLFRKKRDKLYALLVAILIGWSMGIYKMLIGDHYVSHTLIAMLLAWLIILVIKKIVDRLIV